MKIFYQKAIYTVTRTTDAKRADAKWPPADLYTFFKMQKQKQKEEVQVKLFTCQKNQKQKLFALWSGAKGPTKIL